VPATREDFFDPFVTFRREMDRMFDDFFGGSALRPAYAGWQGTRVPDEGAKGFRHWSDSVRFVRDFRRCGGPRRTRRDAE
jgi:hypothetical protein